MTRLAKPINVEITGVEATGQAILIVGSSPLPLNDNAVTVILFGLDISVDAAATIQIKSADTILYDKKFTAAGRDNVTAIQRMGHPTQSMKAFVSGTGGSTITKIIADVGFEYNGGVKAIGG